MNTLISRLPVIFAAGTLFAFVPSSTAWAAGDYRLPPANGQYDSQLGGAYDPPEVTNIVSRDRMAPPAAGLYNICYINAFQTQPAETQWWVDNHPDLLLRSDGGFAEDDNWPGEYLFDTSTEPKRLALATIVKEWITQCAQDGYDAIEPDNLDSYLRSNGQLTDQDNLVFAESLLVHAHGLGLAFAQKNSGDLGDRGKRIGLDFAIVEGCQVYDECQDYVSVYGPHVLEIEYTDTDPSYFAAACAARGREISIIRRDRNLTVPGEKDYHYEQC